MQLSLNPLKGRTVVLPADAEISLAAPKRLICVSKAVGLAGIHSVFPSLQGRWRASERDG